MFDTDRFLNDQFGGDPARVVAFLRAYCVEDVPSEEAVRKWMKRGSIPNHWLPVLIGFVEIDQGIRGLTCRYLGRAKCDTGREKWKPNSGYTGMQ